MQTHIRCRSTSHHLNHQSSSVKGFDWTSLCFQHLLHSSVFIVSNLDVHEKKRMKCCICFSFMAYFFRNGKPILLEDNLPPPPLPPHKNNCQRQPTPEMKYNPPWPRAPNPYSSIPIQPMESVKPYLKPLPKPPGKESPNRHHR